MVYVFDVIATSPAEVRADLAKLVTPGMHVLVVANKMDLGSTPAEQAGVDPTTWIPIAAREGMNVPYLKDKLYEAVLSEKVSADSTIVSNARHYEALEKSYEALAAVLQGMANGVTSDFIAMDIRRSLHHLGEITGEISTDDLLGNIFGKFCIGK